MLRGLLLVEKMETSLEKKVQSVCGSWRSGKFLPLTQRPFSINTYALSKVWFRTGSVNLREGDFKSINSSLKKWLYSDLFFKPEEIVLYRKVKDGGLGLTSSKHKSLAYLIKSFLELAANPSYLQSLYLNIMYRVYILKENLPAPPLPPYYNGVFFDTICEAKNSGNPIIDMSLKQWYDYLIEKDIIMDQDKTLLPCKVEKLYPDVNWNEVWLNVRLTALPNASKSFAWKLAHNLLPVEEKLYGASVLPSNICKFSCPGDPVGNLEHCFFYCQLTTEVGTWLLDVTKIADQNATASKIIKLDIHGNDGLLFLSVKALEFCWSKRAVGKNAVLSEFKTHLNADLRLMLNTKHKDVVEKVQSLMGH